MDWTAVAAISEAVGALGVILSLLYLASQVRQNTKLSRAATRQALADGAQGLASDAVEVDSIARIMQDAMDGKEVKPHERLRMQARCLRDLRFWDNAFYQHTEGLLTDAEWEPFRENLRIVMQFPAYRDYWENFQLIFSAPFRAELNHILSEEHEFDLREALNRGRSSNEAE